MRSPECKISIIRCQNTCNTDIYYDVMFRMEIDLQMYSTIEWNWKYKSGCKVIDALKKQTYRCMMVLQIRWIRYSMHQWMYDPWNGLKRVLINISCVCRNIVLCVCVCLKEQAIISSTWKPKWMAFLCWFRPIFVAHFNCYTRSGCL